RYRPPGNAESLALRIGPVRVEARVADYVDLALSDDARLLRQLLDKQARRIDEDLRAGAAIDVHFLIWLARPNHLDHRWRKSRSRAIPAIWPRPGPTPRSWSVWRPEMRKRAPSIDLSVRRREACRDSSIGRAWPTCSVLLFNGSDTGRHTNCIST